MMPKPALQRYLAIVVFGCFSRRLRHWQKAPGLLHGVRYPCHKGKDRTRKLNELAGLLPMHLVVPIFFSRTSFGDPRALCQVSKSKLSKLSGVQRFGLQANPTPLRLSTRHCQRGHGTARCNIAVASWHGFDCCVEMCHNKHLRDALLRASVSIGSEAKREPPQPVRQNLALSGMCGLPAVAVAVATAERHQLRQPERC